MTFDSAPYRTGYSIGVGAVVVCGERVLLVHVALGSDKDQWAIPGGFVERGETVDAAVHREVFEEAGVQADMRGLIAARSRVRVDENSAYFIFLLATPHAQTAPDGVEIDEARYFTLDEALALPDLNPLSRLVIAHALQGKTHVLTSQPHPTIPAMEYVLFI
jgi:ADP-ribose pyrophosphatase YjhB (NUDIX family)